MKAARFEYARPRDVAEAVKLLAEAKGEAKPIAGGQSLGPMLNLRLARPKLLVDIGRIASLAAIESRDGVTRIGANVTHSAIEDARGTLPGGEPLAAVASGIAYRAIRNRGTIGGSLAHADPAADWPLALAALGANVIIEGTKGTRSVPADKFMRGAFTTVLADDEIVAAIEVPKLSAAARWGYYKFCKKTGEFPDASGAAFFDPERGVARVFAGALSRPPQGFDALARGVAQQGAAALTTSSVDQALAAVAPDLDLIDRKIHVAAVMRAVKQVLPS